MYLLNQIYESEFYECLQVMRDSAGTCGTTRWKAAKAISKTMANLDETGLEVAGCRHVIGQKAINMFRGEMLVSLLHYQV